MLGRLQLKHMYKGKYSFIDYELVTNEQKT